MTDPRNRLRHRPREAACARRAGHRRAFPRRHARLSSPGGEGVAGRAPTARSASVALHAGGILCAASDGKRIVTGGDDGKVVAIEAAGEPKRSRPTPSAAGSTMSRCMPTARSHGRPARPRPSQRRRATKIARRALDRRRACFLAEGLSPRGRALQRRDAVVSQHGRRRRNFTHGKARISTSRVSPTGASSSPRCRRARCMAGASPTARTCA